MKSIKTMLQGVTQGELREWAGDLIFSRGRSYVSSVSQLSRTEDGSLAAWVSGNDEYATTVRRDGEGDYDYDCSCPYDDGPCKHAVAVALAAVEALKAKRDIPLLDPCDDLALELFGDPEDDDWLDEDENEPDYGAATVKSDSAPGSRIESHLSGKTREELLALLVELASCFPEVARRISDAAQIETGKSAGIVRALRKEIRSLTAESAWRNHWNDEGNLPDYSHVATQLELLLDNGHADAVLDLGEELWQRGRSQVEHSDDEGETAMEIASCLEIVVRALPVSSLGRAKQLLWLIDHGLDDEYGLLDGLDDLKNDQRYGEDEWLDVASVLEERLSGMALPSSGSFSATYARNNLMAWLCDAYRRSGQQQRVIPLLEREADNCRGYETLVKSLLETGEREKARQWCVRGFGRTVKDAPGIAADLRDLLRKMAEEDGKLELAAAYRAEEFFDHPSVNRYEELRAVAERTGLWDGVRVAILDYLRNGKNPVIAGKKWPLPVPEVERERTKGHHVFDSFPKRELLIDIAILERRHDDAVAIFDELNAVKRWDREVDKRLARSVSDSHPDVALRIWKGIADALIGQVKPKAYQEAAGYLVKMHEVYGKTGRLAEWRTLIASLRVEHKPKRRLMETLNDLEI